MIITYYSHAKFGNNKLCRLLFYREEILSMMQNVISKEDEMKPMESFVGEMESSKRKCNRDGKLLIHYFYLFILFYLFFAMG